MSSKYKRAFQFAWIEIVIIVHLNPELRYLPGYPNSMSLGHIKTIYYLDFKNCHGKYWYYKLTQNY